MEIFMWGLPVLFFILGMGLCLGGIRMILVLYGRNSIEVEAKCIRVDVRDEVIHRVGNQHVRYKNVKVPTYEYYYEGKKYVASPLLHSNRSGYMPEEGYCRIFINPKHPDKVYSTERRMAGGILIGIGILWILIGIAGVVIINIIR